VEEVVICPVSVQAVAASNAMTLKFWNLNTGDCLKTLIPW